MQLITAPASPVVTLADLKAHLRVDHGDEDVLIASLEAAAVAYLDGYGGILGRAIKQQVWRWEVSAWGVHDLPLPDVSAVAVTYASSGGGEMPATSSVLLGNGQVEIAGPEADRIFINMTCAMSARYLPTVEMAVKLIVSHWYDDRAAGAIPVSADMLVSSIRHNRL